MSDLQAGSDATSQKAASQRYSHRPTEMASRRIDAHASYVFDPRYSISLSVPWVRNAMNMSRVGMDQHVDHSQCGERWGFSSAWDNGAMLKHEWHKRKMRSIEGVGDLRIEGSIRLLSEGDVESGLHRLYVRPGLKAPTGDYNVRFFDSYYDPCMQPGTGSWDPLAHVEYRFDQGRFGVSLSGSYQLTTRNPEGYEYGDVASVGVYPSWQLFRMVRLTSGLRYRSAERAKDHKGLYTDAESLMKVTANTGGDLADALLAIDILPANYLTLTVGVSLPVWSDLNGIQLRPGELYTAGATVRF